jgi:hypothetical protein
VLADDGLAPFSEGAHPCTFRDRADVAQLVERKLPKLEVAGSNPVVRFP